MCQDGITFLHKTYIRRQVNVFSPQDLIWLVAVKKHPQQTNNTHTHTNLISIV